MEWQSWLEKASSGDDPKRDGTNPDSGHPRDIKAGGKEEYNKQRKINAGKKVTHNDVMHDDSFETKQRKLHTIANQSHEVFQHPIAIEHEFSKKPNPRALMDEISDKDMKTNEKLKSWQSWLKKETQPTGLKGKKLALWKKIQEDNKEDSDNQYYTKASWESWLDKNNAIEASHKVGEKKHEWDGKFSNSTIRDDAKDEKAMDEESDEIMEDAGLEEIEKLKSWQVFLKAFGGTESKVPKVKNPEKVEEGGFTAADLENPPKRVKGKFPNWVKETGKIESSGNEKTSLEGDVQYSGGLKRGNLDPKHVEDSAKLAFQTEFGNSGTASGHLGGTERVPPKKTQAELDEEFFKKSWEEWLNKEAVTPSRGQLREGNVPKDYEYRQGADMDTMFGTNTNEYEFPQKPKNEFQSQSNEARHAHRERNILEEIKDKKVGNKSPTPSPEKPKNDKLTRDDIKVGHSTIPRDNQSSAETIKPANEIGMPDIRRRHHIPNKLAEKLSSWEGWLAKYTETEEDKKLSVELSEARAVDTGKIPKRRTKPEEGVDAKKDEISQINAFKWASWLEKMQGAGDARFGNQHLTGLEQEPIRGESMEITPEKEEKYDKKEREDEETDEKEDNKPYKALGGEED